MKKTWPGTFVPWANMLLVGIAVSSSPCVSASSSEIFTLYLNSHNFCGRNKRFPVHKNLMYKIEIDVSPDSVTSSFLECEMTFQAEDINSRICLAQDDLMGTLMNDKNVVLTARDGEKGNDTLIFKVLYFGSHLTRWMALEYCTNTRFLTLKLRKRFLTTDLDVKALHISLKVMDITSRKRTFYLDKDICQGNITLQNSEVSVFSRRKPGAFFFKLEDKCEVSVKKDPPRSNRSICMVYLSQGEPDCSSNWSLVITGGVPSVPDRYAMYKLVCEFDPKAKRNHAWCASDSTKDILIMHVRKVEVFSNSTLEWPRQYHLLLSDFPGGDAEKLLEKIEREIAERNNKKKAGFNMWWLLIGVGCALAVFIVFGVTWRCRQAHRSEKKGSEDDDDDDDDDEGSRIENNHMESESVGKSSVEKSSVVKSSGGKSSAAKSSEGKSSAGKSSADFD